ncbi:hypothetical protein [Metabacillus fastidiosus]|uniref:hypothetical protein n=1 Tax=Metabacillus fastidiosus TaxID=1458 RepID=UPI003D266C03
MAVTHVPDLSISQNVGFDLMSTAPIIHSVRWRHLPSRYVFTDVDDVITYHQGGPLEIDIKTHTVSYLDVYFLQSANITQASVFLRYLRASDGVLIEEPYKFGEKGTAIALTSDPTNTALQVIRGIAFTQNDLQDGTPMYDFVNMAEEGVYEVWVRAITGTGEELHVRIPFQWANLLPSTGGGGGGTGGTTPPPIDGQDHSPKLEHYDEYHVTIVEGSSVFTKRPGTHFRMAGIGMLMNPYCYQRFDTPPQPVIDNPVEEPIIGDEPAPPCALTVDRTEVTGKIGDTVTFQLQHTNKSGVLKVEATYDQSALQQTGDTSFTTLATGTYPVTFVVTYNDSQECTVQAQVVCEFTCVFKVTADQVKVNTGTVINLTFDHGINVGSVAKVDLQLPTGVTKSGAVSTNGASITSTTDGAHVITVEVDYGNGNICSSSVIIEFEVVGPPPLECGKLSSGSKNGKDIRPMSIDTAGTIYIDFDVYEGKDDIAVYDLAGNLIWSITDATFKHTIVFQYDPLVRGGGIKIAMNENGGGSVWEYVVYCPNDTVAQHIIDRAVAV